MNFVAGLICRVVRGDEEAFRVMCGLFRGERYNLRQLFCPAQAGRGLFPLVFECGWILDKLVQAHDPELSSHFDRVLRSSGLPSGLFSGANAGHLTIKWFMKLWVTVLPDDVCVAVFDRLIAEGVPALLRIAMLTLEDRRNVMLSINDMGLLQSQKWHGGRGEPVPDLWTRTKPAEIMRRASSMPPTVAEFDRLREEYARAQM